MHVPDAIQQLVGSADIAVAVLLNTAGNDAEFIPLQPRPFPERTVLALEIECAPRQLRFVGIMAWTDGAIRSHLEALPEPVAARLSRSFEAYLTAFSADSKVN